ncbi:MAG: phage portal protein [Acidobacteria bacterium]|nr:phage portal protein [Acidobacteriota bacterium]
MWPFRREPEKRESLPFTDAVVAALTAQAAGTAAGDPSAIAALEAASALYASAFRAAKLTPAVPALNPGTMALVARNLLRHGEDVHLIDVQGGEVRLIPCGSWDVRGPWREPEWWYRADTFGPSGNATHFVPSGGVLHFRYAVDSARPWYGISPLGWARSTGALASNLETRLAEEAGGPVGSIIPVPTDGGDGGDDDPLASIKADIAGAKGRPVLTETTAAGWGEGRAAAPAADWRPQRYGAAVPAPNVTLRTDASMAVLSACAVPVSLVVDSDGTSQREAWRRFVMGSVEPLLTIVAQEIAQKLDTSVSFDLTSLWAHDLAGRASSFKALIAGGLPVNEALATAGLMESEG